VLDQYLQALRDRVIAALAAALLLYYAATPGIFQGKLSGDGLINFLYLPSLVVHGTTDLRPAREAAGAHWILPRHGQREVSEKPLGPPLLMLPLYLVSLAVEAGVRAVSPVTLVGRPFGQNALTYWISGLATVLCGIAGIAACFVMLRRRFSLAASRFGTVAAVAATPVTWYLVHQPGYQHGMAFALVAILVERWDAWRRSADAGSGGPSRRLAVQMGVAAGMAILIRAQEGGFLLLPAIDVLSGLWRGRPATSGPAPAVPRREWLVQGLLIAGSAAALAALQLGYWKVSMGSFRPPLASTGYLRLGQSEVVGLLFSTRAGLFTWSPIAYLAVLGLWVGRRRLGTATALLVLAALPQIYLDACPLDWWGAWTYGARRLTDLGILFALALAGVWEAAAALRGASLGPALRGACLALGTWAVLFNVATMEAVRTGRLPSTGSAAYGTWEWLWRAGAPPWLIRLSRRTGTPLAWPASIPFAVMHRVPIRSFEEVYGNYFVETAYAYGARPLFNMSLELSQPWSERFLFEGFGEIDVRTGVSVAPGARALVPIFVRAPLRLMLEGTVPSGPEATVIWNGVRCPVQRSATLPYVDVPITAVRFGINTVRFELPPGTRLTNIHFQITLLR
jgi:hypothetical protein